MEDVTVDPAARIATVEAGCTSGSVLAAAQKHGLAPLIGSVPSVGAVGFTLGGGVGWLSRKYGPACDAARSFDVVTPDGCLVHATATANRDLFAALRGGGGGALGVVTAMEIDLFPVTTVYARQPPLPGLRRGRGRAVLRPLGRRSARRPHILGRVHELPADPRRARGDAGPVVPHGAGLLERRPRRGSALRGQLPGRPTAGHG